MDKTRILKAWWRICVVDRRLCALEGAPDRKERKTQDMERRYWDSELEKLSLRVSAAAKIPDVTAEWGDDYMDMNDSRGLTFLRLFINDPLKIEEINNDPA